MGRKEGGPTNSEGIGIRRKRGHGRLARLSFDPSELKIPEGGMVDAEGLRELIRQKQPPHQSKRGFNS